MKIHDSTCGTSSRAVLCAKGSTLSLAAKAVQDSQHAQSDSCRLSLLHFLAQPCDAIGDS